VGLVVLATGVWGAGWLKLILDAERGVLGVIVVADEAFDVGGDGEPGERCMGGGVEATRGAIGWVVSTRNILCEDTTRGGPQCSMNPFEGCVGGFVPAAPCPPCFNDSLVVSINRKRCGGAVEYQQRTD